MRLMIHMAARLLLPVLVFIAGHVQAQDVRYPTKPIRLVVPFPPGGTGDTVARLVVQRWGELLKQPVVVDNRGGAGGNIGIDIVAKATPDGYTIGLFDTALVVNPSLYAKLPFDTQADLTPIMVTARGPLVLAVHPSFPAGNLREFLAHVRSRPGAFPYGSAGNGTPVHLAMEMLKSAVQLDVQHVPYKGGGPVMQDLVGGQIPMAFAAPGTARPHIAAGKLRPLAVTGPRRLKDLPDVPTFVESGITGVDATLIVGFLAPAKTPGAIVRRLHDTLASVMTSPEVTERMNGLSLDLIVADPERSAAILKDELALWTRVVRSTGAKAE